MLITDQGVGTRGEYPGASSSPSRRTDTASPPAAASPDVLEVTARAPKVISSPKWPCAIGGYCSGVGVVFKQTSP